MRRQSSEGLTKAGGSFSKMAGKLAQAVGRRTQFITDLCSGLLKCPPSLPPPPPPEQMIKIEAGAPVFSRI